MDVPRQWEATDHVESNILTYDESTVVLERANVLESGEGFEQSDGNGRGANGTSSAEAKDAILRILHAAFDELHNRLVTLAL